MRVLRVTGIEAEAELAFAGLYSLLHPIAGYLGALPERQAAAIEGGVRTEARRSRSGTACSRGGHPRPADQRRGDRALLILVDDLHWLDPASAEALLFALRRLDRDAVACVLTFRWVADAGRPAELCLAGLGPEAAAQLIDTVAIAGRRPRGRAAARRDGR